MKNEQKRTMTALRICTVIFLSYLGSFVTGQVTTCPDGAYEPVTISETDLPGTKIMTLNISHAISFRFAVNNHKQLEEYFATETGNTTVTLVVNKTVDLEAIFEKWGIKVSVIIFTVSCDQSGPPAGTVNQLFVTVNGVNEFDPEFVNAPFEINVPENTAIDTSLFNLRNNSRDQDVNTGGDEITRFELYEYYAPELDGRNYFKMPNVQQGIIEVARNLDYEGIGGDLKYYKLSLRVYDSGHLTGTTTMRINILDVDDQPPEFFEPGCTRDCYVLYEATIDVNFTGLIENIHPYKIQARDKDTLNYPVSYSIKGISPRGFESHFKQNASTGEVYVIKPFSDTSDNLTLVTLFLEVEEMDGQHFTAQTSFKINLDRGWPPTTVGPDAEKVAAAGADSTLMTVLIVLAVVVFVLATAFLVSVICIKKKYRKPVHPDESPSASEKDTDVEDLSIEGQEQWPSTGGNHLNGLPVGRRQELPPLKDMGTGTDDSKKNRRSRRRKKEKDTSEFDGTQNYEGSAEPEFYEQKKARVKQSSRSKLQTDPKYWITVDNDY